MVLGQVRTDKEGTEWVHMVGGLFMGRCRDGRIRICQTNGLEPWDEKAQPTYHELQPEHFRTAATFLLGKNA